MLRFVPCALAVFNSVWAKTHGSDIFDLVVRSLHIHGLQIPFVVSTTGRIPFVVAPSNSGVLILYDVYIS